MVRATEWRAQSASSRHPPPASGSLSTVSQNNGGTTMRQDTRTLARAAFTAMLGILSIPLTGPTDVRAQIPPAPYNPFPSGILPANIDSERSRIEREVQTIFGRYFAEWQALTPT